MSILPENKLRITSGYRLQWEEAQQSYVLLYPEGMVTLNGSSAEILKYCDGTRNAEGIIGELQKQFPDADLADDVREFIAAAFANGWIRGV
jgi:pyrroloquinoline quinone biosynthesis protein D